MAAAKSALKAVLKKVPQSTRIGLLVFSASNLQDDWAYPLGPRDDAALSKAIDRPEPGSGTPSGPIHQGRRGPAFAGEGETVMVTEVIAC